MDKTAKFSDAYISRYRITPVNDSNITDTPDYLKNNIRISRENTIYELLHKHCLFTVNGFYHNSYLDNSIVVIDGFKTMNVSKQNQVGIYSFRNVGELNKLPITEEMITTNNDGTVYLNIDNDIINKQVFISIAGYFHLLDNNIFSQTGVSTFKIDFNKMSLLDRFFELKRFINLSTLPLSIINTNPNLVNIEQLLSDDCLIEILKLTQSFIIILDTPVININKYGNIKKTGFPGQYITYSEPKYPLVNGLGRHSEYIKEKEEIFLKDRPYNKDQWLINVYDNFVYDRLYNSSLKDYVQNTDGNLRPVYTGEYSDAYFLEISKP